MARPRSFDPDTAIDGAVARFWAHGYAATSVRDLGDAMGLGSASLYAAFGTKRGVFEAALDRYLAQNMRARLAECENLPPRAAIAAFLETTVERSLRDPRGCLLVNAAIDVAPHDAGLGAVVAARLGEIEAFFTRCLAAGQRNGSIAVDAPDDVARLLLAAILGLRVLARSRPERPLLEGIARQALALLGPNMEETDP